jgi:hypothetical protein
MNCTSPASSAAIRDGSDVISRNVTLSHAGRGPQYASLRASSMRSPLAKRTNFHGPVPTIALPESKSALVASCAARFDTMITLDMSDGMLG